MTTFCVPCSQCKKLNFISLQDDELDATTRPYYCEKCKVKRASQTRKNQDMETLLKTVTKIQQTLNQLVAHVKCIETHVEYRPCGPGATKAKANFERILEK